MDMDRGHTMLSSKLSLRKAINLSAFFRSRVTWSLKTAGLSCRMLLCCKMGRCIGLPGHRSMDASWHWPSSTNSISSGYERKTAPLGNFPPSFPAASRRRHSYYGYRSANEGRPLSAGE